MHSPKPPAADPAIAAAQAAEQRRAETSQVNQTQLGLNADTIALRRRFGVMASSVAGGFGGFTGVSTPGTSGGSAPPAFVSGGGGGFAGGGFGGLGNGSINLY